MVAVKKLFDVCPDGNERLFDSSGRVRPVANFIPQVIIPLAIKDPTAYCNRSSFLLKIIRFISGAYENLSGWRRCVLHDPLAAGVCLYPDFIKSELRYVDVELTGELTRGMTVVDRRERTPSGDTRMRVALEVDSEGFKKNLMNSLLYWVNNE